MFLLNIGSGNWIIQANIYSIVFLNECAQVEPENTKCKVVRGHKFLANMHTGRIAGTKTGYQKIEFEQVMLDLTDG